MESGCHSSETLSCFRQKPRHLKQKQCETVFRQSRDTSDWSMRNSADFDQTLIKRVRFLNMSTRFRVSLPIFSEISALTDEFAVVRDRLKGHAQKWEVRGRTVAVFISVALSAETPGSRSGTPYWGLSGYLRVADNTLTLIGFYSSPAMEIHYPGEPEARLPTARAQFLLFSSVNVCLCVCSSFQKVLRSRARTIMWLFPCILMKLSYSNIALLNVTPVPCFLMLKQTI